MIEVKINDAKLQQAAEAGMDEFVKAFVDAIREAIGGELTAETMAQLNSDQITLLAWDILHEEMMDGGMVQLIHNGYGAFLWKNPTDKAFKNWGLTELAKLIKKSHFLYKTNHEEIERDPTDEEFMALYEKFPSLMILTMSSLRTKKSGPARLPSTSMIILTISAKLSKVNSW